MFTILRKSNNTFRGPFTDDPAPLIGETKVALTDGQKSDFDSLVIQTNPTGAIIVFDTTFRFATLDESANAAPTLRWQMIFLFRKITSSMDRAKLQPMYFTLSGMFDAYGEDCEKSAQARGDMKTMIADALADEDNTELEAIQAQLLALPKLNA